jgi:gluconate kinase
MPPSLLRTQFEDLEELQADEAGVSVDITRTPKQIVDTVIAVIHQKGAVHAD